VWLSKSAPGYDSFPESLEVFYETWDLFESEHAKGQLTPREFQILNELYFMIKKFDQTTDDQIQWKYSKTQNGCQFGKKRKIY